MSTGSMPVDQSYVFRRSLLPLIRLFLANIWVNLVNPSTYQATASTHASVIVMLSDGNVVNNMTWLLPWGGSNPRRQLPGEGTQQTIS
jgi:hypothetical protein